MEQDVDPMGDIDPSLSVNPEGLPLNAEGLWSDEESENDERIISDEEQDREANKPRKAVSLALVTTNI